MSHLDDSNVPGGGEPTPPSLLERARNAEEGAWERLERLCSPLIRSWCRTAGVPPSDISDLCQIVLEGVHSGLAAFELNHQRGTFRGWVRVITRNKVADYFRKKEQESPGVGGSHYQRFLEQLPAVLPDEVDEATGETEIAILFQQALSLAQRDFSEQTYQAFYLSVVEGRSSTEVGKELGMKDAAVRKARSRVLQRLREELKGLWGKESVLQDGS